MTGEARTTFLDYAVGMAREVLAGRVTQSEARQRVAALRVALESQNGKGTN